MTDEKTRERTDQTTDRGTDQTTDQRTDRENEVAVGGVPNAASGEPRAAAERRTGQRGVDGMGDNGNPRLVILEPGREIFESDLSEAVFDVSPDMTFRDFCAVLAGLSAKRGLFGFDLGPYLAELDAPRTDSNSGLWQRPEIDVPICSPSSLDSSSPLARCAAGTASFGLLDSTDLFVAASGSSIVVRCLCSDSESGVVLERVEFEWELEISDRGRRGHTELRLHCYGVGPDGPERMDGGEYINQRYGLAFSPWNTLAQLPIVLSETMVIARFGADGLTRERVPAPAYELGELVEAFLDATAIHGSPEGRDALLGALRERMDAAIANPESLVSSEELFASLREKYGPREGRDPYPAAAAERRELPAGEERISDVLGVLDACWRRYPALRLGQLLVNVVGVRAPVPELFYVPDAELARRASEWRGR